MYFQPRSLLDISRFLVLKDESFAYRDGERQKSKRRERPMCLPSFFRLVNVTFFEVSPFHIID